MKIDDKIIVSSGKHHHWRAPELAGLFLAFVVSLFLWFILFMSALSLAHL